MATDIAALGLQVDSTPVAKATGELQQFSAAAAKADVAARGMGTGADKASTATAALAQNINRAVNSATAINQRLGVGGFASPDRAADVAAYGRSLDELRAKYNPLFQVEQRRVQTITEINQALRVGALSQTEHAAAVQRVEVASKLQTMAIKRNEAEIAKAGKTAALSSFQMTNLGFQINDVATQAALGMDPMRILAAQAGQFYQILAQGEGGVSGSLRFLGQTFVSLLTPIRVATTGVAAFAAAVIIAGNSWAQAQNQIQLALLGIGGATGVTVTQINQIAIAAAAAGQATVGEAREMALAFVATGRVTAEIAAQAVAIGRNFSKVFGEDIADSASRLAKALADPAKGVDDLNKRLAAFDDRSAQAIKNLTQQGRYLEAQRMLLDGVKTATDGASQATYGWAQVWVALSRNASEFWANFSRESARFLGMDNIEDRINSLRQSIENLNNHPMKWFFKQQLSEDIAELGRLEKALVRLKVQATESTLNRDSSEFGDMIRSLVPDLAEFDRLVAQVNKLQSFNLRPELTSRLSETAKNSLDTALRAAQTMVDGHKTSLEMAIAEHDIAIDTIDAKTVAERGQIAFREAILRLQRAGDPNSFIKADMARTLEETRLRFQIAEAQAQQTNSAQQRVQSAQQELSLVGQSAAVQERAKATLEVRQQLEAEALRQYGDRNAFDQKHLDALTAEAIKLAEINALVRQRQLMDDLNFERAQMGRAGLEQDVYSRLRQAGLLTNGEIESAAAQAAAQQIRLNGFIRESAESGREFTRSFVSDMMAGKSATEALANGLNRLAQKLADLASDWAFQSLFGGKGGANSGIAGLFGSSNPMAGSGGWDAVVVPSLHRGGNVGSSWSGTRSIHPGAFAGARRYHKGGLAGDEVPAILQKGERVIPRGGGGDFGGMNVTVPINVDASGAYPESIAQIKAAMEQVVAGLPARVLSVVRDARDRRLA